MTSPVEAEAHLEEVEASNYRPPKKAFKVSVNNTLFRTLQSAWGLPFKHNTFVFCCLLARRIFCPEASPRAMMLNFQSTFEKLVEHSREFGQREWSRLLYKLFYEEALASRLLGDEGVQVEALVTPRHRTHFIFNRHRWFPEIRSTRQRVQARLLALQAAKKCHVSPLMYLWENDLVDFTFFPR